MKYQNNSKYATLSVDEIVYSKSKNKLKDLDFSRTVTLKEGAKDFLADNSWKEEFISGRSIYLILNNLHKNDIFIE